MIGFSQSASGVTETGFDGLTVASVVRVAVGFPMPKTVALERDLNGRKPPPSRFCAGTFRSAAYSDFARHVTAEPEDCASSQPFLLDDGSLAESLAGTISSRAECREDSSDVPAEETLALS